MLPPCVLSALSVLLRQILFDHYGSQPLYLLFKYAQASALRLKTRCWIVSVRYALMLPVKIASNKSGGR